MNNIELLKTKVKTYTEVYDVSIYYDLIFSTIKQIFFKFFQIYEKELGRKFNGRIYRELDLYKKDIWLFIYYLKNERSGLNQRYVKHILQIIYEKSGINLENEKWELSSKNLDNYEKIYKLAKPFGITSRFYPIIYVEY